MRFIISTIMVVMTMTSYSQSMKTILDNEHIKITEYTSLPNQDVCGKDRHSHLPHATILLTNADVRVINEDGTVINQHFDFDKKLLDLVHDGKKQQVAFDGAFWSGTETHTVINTGTAPLRFYLIEKKN